MRGKEDTKLKLAKIFLKIAVILELSTTHILGSSFGDKFSVYGVI